MVTNRFRFARRTRSTLSNSLSRTAASKKLAEFHTKGGPLTFTTRDHTDFPITFCGFHGKVSVVVCDAATALMSCAK